MPAVIPLQMPPLTQPSKQGGDSPVTRDTAANDETSPQATFKQAYENAGGGADNTWRSASGLNSSAARILPRNEREKEQEQPAKGKDSTAPALTAVLAFQAPVLPTADIAAAPGDSTGAAQQSGTGDATQAADDLPWGQEQVSTQPATATATKEFTLDMPASTPDFTALEETATSAIASSAASSSATAIEQPQADQKPQIAAAPAAVSPDQAIPAQPLPDTATNSKADTNVTTQANATTPVLAVPNTAPADATQVDAAQTVTTPIDTAQADTATVANRAEVTVPAVTIEPAIPPAKAPQTSPGGANETSNEQSPKDTQTAPQTSSPTVMQAGSNAAAAAPVAATLPATQAPLPKGLDKSGLDKSAVSAANADKPAPKPLSASDTQARPAAPEQKSEAGDGKGKHDTAMPALDPAVPPVTVNPAGNDAAHSAAMEVAVLQQPVRETATATVSPKTQQTSAADTGSLAASINGSSGDTALPYAAINTAHLIQRMSESELRVGLHSSEFGNIGIRTSVGHDQIAAQITVERSDLGRALSDHVPALQDKLSREHGVNTEILIQDHSAGFSGGLDQGSRNQQQPSSQQSQALPNQAPGNDSGDRYPVRAAAVMTPVPSTDDTRLDIRV